MGFMTFLSVCLGFATMIIPRAVTFYISTALLVLFGLRMLYEGWNMSPNEGQEEFDEVSEELRKKEVVKLMLNSYVHVTWAVKTKDKGSTLDE